jgi:hypothetical protein
MPVVLVLPLDLIFKRTASERKIKSKKRNETRLATSSGLRKIFAPQDTERSGGGMADTYV